MRRSDFNHIPFNFYLHVGNQDSLQRGLRRATNGKFHDRAHLPLETRTRFKEDCDTELLPCVSESFAKLETRTRFKEDCDFILTDFTPSGEVISMLETRTRFKEDCDSDSGAHTHHRNSRPSWKPGLASKRIATFPSSTPFTSTPRRVGNQDSLQRGLRRVSCLGGEKLLAGGWKPGLASKRIATTQSGASNLGGIIMLETRTRFKEDCD